MNIVNDSKLLTNIEKRLPQCCLTVFQLRLRDPILTG